MGGGGEDLAYGLQYVGGVRVEIGWHDQWHRRSALEARLFQLTLQLQQRRALLYHGLYTVQCLEKQVY